jgi:ABC-type antimicrobial peptide transport system ATPase subunit
MDHGTIVEEGDPATMLGNPRTERLRAFMRRHLQGWARNETTRRTDSADP